MGEWFSNPVMLAGLGGMLLPLVVHLASRLWYRRVQWGAMMFLTGASVQSQWKARARQWGILAVRMGLVASVCLAMARPVWRGGSQNNNDHGLTVLVVDRSGSMELDEQGRTRAELAQEAALAVLSSLPAGQRVSLIMAGQESDDSRPTGDLQSLASRLSGRPDEFARADMARSLRQAADLLDRNGAGRRELYVITDAQAANWQSANAEFSRTWNQLQPLAGGGRFVVITVGTHQPENTSVDGLSVINPPVIAGVPAEIEIHLGNHGPGVRTAVPLKLMRGNEVLKEQLVNLSPESSSVVRMSVTLPTVGDQLLRAELAHDRLPADDSMQMVVPVRSPLDVLLVDGGTPANGQRNERDFVPAALAPFAQSGRPGADVARVDVAGDEAFTAESLERYAAVIVANVPELNWEQVQAIEQYAYNGGGVLIAPGPSCDAGDYNTKLWREGAGILPGRLHVATGADGHEATGLVRPDGRWSLRGFVMQGEWDLPLLAIGRYFPIDDLSSQGRVLLGLTNGQPYLVGQQAGRGRVMLLASPLDAEWNLLPATRFYMQLLQSSVHWLAGGEVPNPNLRPGQEWVQPVDASVQGAEIFGPAGWRPMSAKILRMGDRLELRSGPIQAAGVYRLRERSTGGVKWTQLVVQPMRDESNLADLDDNQWSQLQTRLGFMRVSYGQQPLEPALGHDQYELELWWPLLGLAMVLLWLEMFMARQKNGSRAVKGWRVLGRTIVQMSGWVRRQVMGQSIDGIAPAGSSRWDWSMGDGAQITDEKAGESTLDTTGDRPAWEQAMDDRPMTRETLPGEGDRR